MIKGEAIFKKLQDSISEHDPGASSHWQLQHSGFSYENGSFSGLQGFGGYRPSYKGVRRFIHRLLQNRFRNMSSGNPEFPQIDTIAQKITDMQGRAYDLDVLRQTLSLSWLKQQLPPSVFADQASICVIGDGFGSMTSLLYSATKIKTIILVNLTKTLLVDLHFLKLWIGTDKFNREVTLLTSDDLAEDMIPRQGEERRIFAIQAENHELLQFLPSDLVLNIVSMGEMNPETTADYFTDIRAMASNRPVYFYCCNRQEKILPDGTITRFSHYPWSENDQLMVDELCPWHQYYYSAIFPFYHRYDGPVQHRLALMAEN